MMIQPSTLSFLKSLKKNNNKPWFDENRDKYESARTNFQEFITELLHNMAAFDPDMKDLEAKKCMFRINRDIRFSKNKTPYKVNISAHFNKGGKKSVNAGYYIHLQPGGNSFVGGGVWMPEAVELKKLRQEVDYCFPEFKKIVNSPVFKKQYGELEKEDMLVNVPKGYDKENPAGEFLKLKSFVATKNISDEELLSPKFCGELIVAFKALMPLLKFMNRAFD
ncbi:MAG: DUF2461 domain-containing protein [Ginsengibacter sp.]|jgi:uncharacterized protein (TIGR02453 family)